MPSNEPGGSGDFACPYCGTLHPHNTAVCPETDRALSIVHKYSGRLLEEKYLVEFVIGEGGMGVVYRGTQVNIDRKIAIKVFNPETCSDQECMDRFVNEAKFAAAIGHANIIKIYNFGYIDEMVPYIVMEYLEGESLGQALSQDRVLSAERAIDISLQILDALHAVHASNIVHRDLKPENVFMARQTGGFELVKLLDFGISRLVKAEDMDQRLTEAGKMYGTPYYASPEQAEGNDDVDHRADLYSVGILLYEMLAGKLPFRAKSYAALLVDILTKPPPDPRDMARTIPSDLVTIIFNAMEKKPENRYQNAKAMIRDLERVRDAIERGYTEEVVEQTKVEKRARHGTRPGDTARRRKISVTGYAMLTPDEKLNGASPFLKAKIKRSSAPPPPPEDGGGEGKEAPGGDQEADKVASLVEGISQTLPPAPPNRADAGSAGHEKSDAEKASELIEGISNTIPPPPPPAASGNRAVGNDEVEAAKISGEIAQIVEGISKAAPAPVNLGGINTGGPGEEHRSVKMTPLEIPAASVSPEESDEPEENTGEDNKGEGGDEKPGIGNVDMDEIDKGW